MEGAAATRVLHGVSARTGQPTPMLGAAVCGCTLLLAARCRAAGSSRVFLSSVFLVDNAIDRHTDCQKIQDRGRDVLRKLS
eukprot:1510729-Rhodomonas_salina.2